MKRTYWYAAMTKDEAQHGRMIFYEAVSFGRFEEPVRLSNKIIKPYI